MLDSPVACRSATLAEDRAGADSFAVAVAAMTITSATSALEVAIMQPVKASRTVPADSPAAMARDRPVVPRKKVGTRR